MSLRKWVVACVASGVVLATYARAEVDQKADRLWKARCASCHGVDGKAQTEIGQKAGIADYTRPEWQKSRTDDQIRKSIAEGMSRVHAGRTQEMEGYKDRLTSDQIDSLVALIRKFR